MSSSLSIDALEGIEHVTYANKVLAIIIYRRYSASGVHFFTPGSFSQQLAYMKHPTGKIIEPHVHNLVLREVQHTQEVLLIRKGILRVDFYSEGREFISSRTIGPGDVILLASGGHGFEVLDELEMIEVKQGPYTGDQDKTRFLPNTRAQDLEGGLNNG